MIVTAPYCNSSESLWEEGCNDMKESCVDSKWSLSQMTKIGIVNNFERQQKPVCYECIHCRLFICCIAFHTCYTCHAVLKFTVLLYKSYTFGVLKLIFCIQERHLGTLHFVFQDYGTRELTFSMFKSTFQVKKQCFCCYYNQYFKCKRYICYWVLQLLLYFKQVAYYFQVWRLYLMYINAVFDAFCLCVGQISFIWKAKALFWRSKSEISRWVLIFQDELRHKSIHTKDTRHWKWWKLLLMPSNVCAIPEYPLLLALYLDTKRGLKKLFLEEILSMLWMSFQCEKILPHALR